MSIDFNARLARLADAVRALDGGDEIARGLIRLASDMDSYLEARRVRQQALASDLFKKWSEFSSASVEDAHCSCDARIDHERRRLAQRVASDPRWQGGYADALKLLEGEENDQ